MVAIGHLKNMRIPKIKKGTKKPNNNAKFSQTSIYLENKFLKCHIWNRDKLLWGNEIKGPAMIVDYGSTTIIPSKCIC